MDLSRNILIASNLRMFTLQRQKGKDVTSVVFDIFKKLGKDVTSVPSKNFSCREAIGGMLDGPPPR